MTNNQNLNPRSLNSNLRTPLNSSGSSLGARPWGANQTTTRPINKPKSALERIDINKIGKGYLMTEGSYTRSFGLNKDTGLKGQLARVRKAGIKTTTKNLSRKNIEQMHDLLADAISGNAVTSNTYISRRDKTEIMKKSRELAKKPGSKFSFEDRDDLIKIVDEMRRQHRENLLNNDFDDNRNDS